MFKVFGLDEAGNLVYTLDSGEDLPEVLKIAKKILDGYHHTVIVVKGTTDTSYLHSMMVSFGINFVWFGTTRAKQLKPTESDPQCPECGYTGADE